ncbi:MAG: carboxypeptidase PM20D1 [Candidatus Azotimanducaceae bacterium]|jgi:carboxypeptidase PM20D1
MRKLFVSVATAVAVFAGVILIRTMLHTPASQTDDIQTIEITVDDTLIAEHLSQAIQIPTISFQSNNNGDFQPFTDFIQWVKLTYPEVNESLGLEVFGYSMLYRWEGVDPDLQPILLTGHYDVVPVIPGTESQWQHPPFAGEISDGIIWGRGALDDKSAVIAMLEAATLLLQQGYAPTRTIYFSFGHDEEKGGNTGAAAITEHLAQQQVQLAWSLDEGSFVFDGVLPGINKLVAPINVAEKGTVTLVVAAKGAGGHSSMPPKQTAVGVLAAAITKLENNPMAGGLEGISLDMLDTISRDMAFVPRMLFANRWLFGGLLEDQLSNVSTTNAVLRTTTAPTMLTGSIKTNVLPIEATATVNFRIHPRDSVKDVIDHVKFVVADENIEVRALGGAGFSGSTVTDMELAGNGASAVSDKDSAGFKLIAASIKEVYGDVVVTPGLMVAASDSRHYSKVSDNAFRFNPMVVTSKDISGFHGTNEKISVVNMAQGTRTYMQIIRRGSAAE